MICSRILREQGKPYPRTCSVHGFGPCINEMLLIAIDFDDTLTADPQLWIKFIESSKALGHRCICITARRQTDDNIESIDEWMGIHGVSLPVYFTGLASKVEYAKKIGLKVDIWIDDDPKRCALGH